MGSIINNISSTISFNVKNRPKTDATPIVQGKINTKGVTDDLDNLGNEIEYFDFGEAAADFLDDIVFDPLFGATQFLGNGFTNLYNAQIKLVDDIQNTASGALSAAGDAISGGLNAAGSFVEGIWADLSSDPIGFFQRGAQAAGAAVVDGINSLQNDWENFCNDFQKDPLGTLANLAVTTACTAVEEFSLLLNAVGNLAESIVDLAGLIVGVAASAPAALIDIGSIFVTGEGAGALDNVWGNVLNFTSTEYVNDFFGWIYQDTQIGQIIDEHSNLKYGSDTWNIGLAATEIIGTIALTVVTAGGYGVAEGVAVGATSAARVGTQAVRAAGMASKGLEGARVVGSASKGARSLEKVSKYGKAVFNNFKTAVTDQNLYSRSPSSRIFDKLFGRGEKAVQASKAPAYTPPQIQYSIQNGRLLADGKDLMSEKTFAHFQNLLQSDERTCVSQIHSAWRDDIFEEGLRLNGRGGMGDLDYARKLRMQDAEARALGQKSYLQTMQEGGYSINAQGIQDCFAVNRGGEWDNSQVIQILDDLHRFDQLDIEASLYYDIDDFGELSRRISGAALGRSEGMKPVDGAIVLRLPSELESTYVDATSPIVQRLEDGLLSIKPEFIEGYYPVDANGVIGEMIPNPNFYGNVGAATYSKTATSSIADVKSLLSDTKFIDSYKAGDLSGWVGPKAQELSSLKTELLDNSGLAEAFKIVDKWGAERQAPNYVDRLIEAYSDKGWDAIKGSVTRNKGGSVNPQELFSKYTADELRTLYDLSKL